MRYLELQDVETCKQYPEMILQLCNWDTEVDKIWGGYSERSSKMDGM